MDGYPVNARRTCGARNQADGICLQAPLRDAEFCFWHDPAHAKEAADARRLGGQRRKREATVAGAYDVDGLGTIPNIRRVLELIKGIEAQGIAPTAVSTAYWRTVQNRLMTRETVPDYGVRQHAAHLKFQRMLG